jgi:hypothetical protein
MQCWMMDQSAGDPAVGGDDAADGVDDAEGVDAEGDIDGAVGPEEEDDGDARDSARGHGADAGGAREAIESDDAEDDDADSMTRRHRALLQPQRKRSVASVSLSDAPPARDADGAAGGGAGIAVGLRAAGLRGIRAVRSIACVAVVAVGM